jgi:hypothetical protein
MFRRILLPCTRMALDFVIYLMFSTELGTYRSSICIVGLACCVELFLQETFAYIPHKDACPLKDQGMQISMGE